MAHPTPPADSDALSRAFDIALDPQGSAAEVFAGELHAALPWLRDETSRLSAHDMLARRRAAQKGAANEPELLPGKDENLVETLAQPRGGVEPNSADALIHIYANIEAQRELHAALAERVFVPRGNFERALAASLVAAGTGISEENASSAAADFVHVRRVRAQGVADALAPGGEVEQQTIALASRLRRMGDADAPVVKNDHKLGEDIAFGMQQTFACWATDFIDPYVGKWFQDHFKDDQHHGTLKHTWGGEIIGDSAAFFVFLGMQRFMPQPVEWLGHAARPVLDPVYDKLGRKNLKAWAAENQLDKDSEEYQRALEEWKAFQAENFAKSSVITVSSIVTNVATQKAMGNTHTLPVIAASKVIGGLITMATMLGLRVFVPKATHQLDQELSDHYFTPLIRRTQKLFGAETEPEGEGTKTYVEKISERAAPGPPER